MINWIITFVVFFLSIIANLYLMIVGGESIGWISLYVVVFLITAISFGLLIFFEFNIEMEVKYRNKK